MARTSGPPGVSVSSKLLSVLDCYTTTRPALTLTEISELSELPLSTTRRLIQELTAWGALERLDSGRYRIGNRLWEVGSLAPGRRGLRGAALPSMQHLHEATRENVQLIVREGIHALCVEKVFGTTAVPTELDIGQRLPLHATGAGKALLAFSPPDVFLQTVEAGLKRYTPYTLTEPGRLASALDTIRREGVAYSHEEKRMGVVAVASPVMNSEQQLVAAVAIVAKVGTRLDRLSAAVRIAALSISRLVD